MQSNPVNPINGQRGIAAHTPDRGGSEYWARRPLRGWGNSRGAKAITHRIERRRAFRWLLRELASDPC